MAVRGVRDVVTRCACACACAVCSPAAGPRLQASNFELGSELLGSELLGSEMKRMELWLFIVHHMATGFWGPCTVVSYYPAAFCTLSPVPVKQPCVLRASPHPAQLCSPSTIAVPCCSFLPLCGQPVTTVAAAYCQIRTCGVAGRRTTRRMAPGARTLLRRQPARLPSAARCARQTPRRVARVRHGASIRARKNVS